MSRLHTSIDARGEILHWSQPSKLKALQTQPAWNHSPWSRTQCFMFLLFRLKPTLDTSNFKTDFFPCRVSSSVPWEQWCSLVLFAHPILHWPAESPTRKIRWTLAIYSIWINGLWEQISGGLSQGSWGYSSFNGVLHVTGKLGKATTHHFYFHGLCWAFQC